jgi:hypothetical protein
MATKKKSQHYRAVESRIVFVDGEQVSVRKGELASADAAVVKVAADLWEPVEEKDFVRHGVEQATAAPGEKRGQTRSRKSRSRKSPSKKRNQKKS